MSAAREKAIAFDIVSSLHNRVSSPVTKSIQISYTAEDLECKYCLHYGGKAKGCVLTVCCCLEEKQQAALIAANKKEG